jgi:uncharacterized protein YndB with AHSA1/START domain
MTKTQAGRDLIVTEREVILTRVLKAPPELVFDAWTDPKQVILWWGPNGFSTTTKHMTAKSGGEWRFIMHGPDGTDFPNFIKFIEVVRPSKLVYKHATENEDEPGQFHVTVTFEPQGNNTLLTMKSVFRSAEDLAFVIREYKADTGAREHADRLEAYLATITKK